MAGFFEQLNLKEDIDKWHPVIDWLVQDKFNKHYWDNYVGSYTKQIKLLERFEKNYSYINLSSLEMPIKRVNNKVFLLQVMWRICSGRLSRIGKRRELRRL